MAKSLLMKFKTDRDKSFSLRVNKVKNDAKEEDVKTLMDSLIKNDVILTSSGTLKVKESAELITTTSEPIDIE
ncbi:DUF2922 domain-containing protein (plasmid) [Clostridium botulinum]|uniref:DUF2922 domain-containing protein n=1 Tax=Clostridium botulinum C/D str. DC5 TaxID=1443128 RepID=A0A0A0HV40_CLOBO|nr:DUF2922 domain-containing protein [Clostridium botulinum]KEI00087.1 hypothetical protein Z952_13970 [Clostridium botulinum C/D str. BKT75002]KEI05938.1 hypothetical protein Z954_14445 [Clostridium botulinum C/D str. BKT2873]KGM92889.1 hypothetical protein Z956_13180 [Clostridium botulinum D str. CCUG 7971]KGM93054.1 hypothetical protein Z955_16125 [Clostridium botulinum C/D str. DC5]KOC47186.1 hypothetical protein ADU88_10800 [Clostridium botulinum]